MIGVNTKTITRLRDHLLVEGSRKSVFMAGAEALEHPLEGDEEAKEVLDAVAEAMYLMISADGVIAEAEREVLRGALRELTVGAMRSALIEQLLSGFEAAKAKDGQEARMNAVASVLAERPEAAEAAFVLSAAVAFADNEIADEENDVLNGFAEKLGISSERAEELLDGLEADGADLITALSPFFDRRSSASPAGPHAFSPDIPRAYAGLSIPRLTLFPGASTLRALSPG